MTSFNGGNNASGSFCCFFLREIYFLFYYPPIPTSLFPGFVFFSHFLIDWEINVRSQSTQGSRCYRCNQSVNSIRSKWGKNINGAGFPRSAFPVFLFLFLLFVPIFHVLMSASIRQMPSEGEKKQTEHLFTRCTASLFASTANNWQTEAALIFQVLPRSFGFSRTAPHFLMFGFTFD